MKNFKKVGNGWIKFDPTTVDLLMANEVIELLLKWKG